MGYDKVHYFEVDFPEETAKKAMAFKKHAVLSNKLIHPQPRTTSSAMRDVG